MSRWDGSPSGGEGEGEGEGEAGYAGGEPPRVICPRAEEVAAPSCSTESDLHGGV